MVSLASNYDFFVGISVILHFLLFWNLYLLLWCEKWSRNAALWCLWEKRKSSQWCLSLSLCVCVCVCAQRLLFTLQTVSTVQYHSYGDTLNTICFRIEIDIWELPLKPPALSCCFFLNTGTILTLCYCYVWQIWSLCTTRKVKQQWGGNAISILCPSS